MAWSKVRQLPTAYFFFADDTGFMALNVSNIEPRAAKALRRIVTSGTSVLVDKEIVLTAISGMTQGCD